MKRTNSLLDKYKANVEAHDRYIQLVQGNSSFMGDMCPFSTEVRLRYAPAIMEKLSTDGSGLNLQDGKRVSDIGDLVKWTHDHLDSLYQPDLDVFKTLFKIYDVVFNSYEIKSKTGKVLANKKGLLALLKEHLGENDLSAINPDDLDLNDFEGSLMNLPANYVLAFNAQGEYEGLEADMRKAIKLANPSISGKELVKRQLKMLFTAHQIYTDAPYSLNDFASLGNSPDAWKDEAHCVMNLGQDRVMRDLYPQ